MSTYCVVIFLALPFLHWEGGFNNSASKWDFNVSVQNKPLFQYNNIQYHNARYHSPSEKPLMEGLDSGLVLTEHVCKYHHNIYTHMLPQRVS